MGLKARSSARIRRRFRTLQLRPPLRGFPHDGGSSFGGTLLGSVLPMVTGKTPWGGGRGEGGRSSWKRAQETVGRT